MLIYYLTQLKIFRLQAKRSRLGCAKMGRLSKPIMGFMLLCCLAVLTEAEYIKYKDPKQPEGATIKDLMTLEEKIGQMVQIERTVATPDVMKQYFIGKHFGSYI